MLTQNEMEMVPSRKIVARALQSNNGDSIVFGNQLQLRARHSRSIEHAKAVDFHLLASTMSLSPLLPLAGAVLKPIADRALDGLASGLSFLETLRQSGSNHIPAIEQDVIGTREFHVAAFQDQFRHRLALLGIDASTPIRLKQNGSGGVLVDGDHPDRVLIESLFSEDEELTELFNTLATIAAGEQRLDKNYSAEDFWLEIDHVDIEIGFA